MWTIGGARRRCVRCRALSKGGHGMTGHAPKRLVEGCRRLIFPALAEMQRPDGVPRIARALTCVEMSRRFGGKFALERRHGAVLVATRQLKQPAQPVQARLLNRDASVDGRRKRCKASHQLAIGLGGHLACDIHRGRQPVRERKRRKDRQRAVCRTEAFFAPSDIGEAEVVPPVVGLERNGALGRGLRVQPGSGAFEHEAKRGPRFARSGSSRQASRACTAATSRASRSGAGSARVSSYSITLAFASPMCAAA